jgi:hypothetical protein
MSILPEYASFLIRLWCEANPNPHAPLVGWRGEMEHIQTGQSWTLSRRWYADVPLAADARPCAER